MQSIFLVKPQNIWNVFVFFLNNLLCFQIRFYRFALRRNLNLLNREVERHSWPLTFPPSTVNAFYLYSRNLVISYLPNELIKSDFLLQVFMQLTKQSNKKKVFILPKFFDFKRFLRLLILAKLIEQWVKQTKLSQLFNGFLLDVVSCRSFAASVFQWKSTNVAKLWSHRNVHGTRGESAFFVYIFIFTFFIEPWTWPK